MEGVDAENQKRICDLIIVKVIMYNKKVFNAALKQRIPVVMPVLFISVFAIIWITSCKGAEWEQLKQKR